VYYQVKNHGQGEATGIVDILEMKRISESGEDLVYRSEEPRSDPLIAQGLYDNFFRLPVPVDDGYYNFVVAVRSNSGEMQTNKYSWYIDGEPRPSA
jgi:hypothetical protein